MSVRDSLNYQPVPNMELEEIVVHQDPVEATGSGIHPVEATGSGITTASEAAAGDNGQGGNTSLTPASRKGKKKKLSKNERIQLRAEQSRAREDDQRQPEARTGTGRPSGQQLVPVREVDAQLHEACQTVNSKLVSELLGKGANPNAPIDNLTPLDVTGEKIPPTHSSPLESFLEVITALIKVGGKPSGVEGAKYRETPLHVAVSLACEDSQHCTECSVCAQCLRAIHLLCEAGYTELLKQTKVEFQKKPYTGSARPIDKMVYMALHAAVAKKWLKGVNKLIEKGADVNAKVIVPAYTRNGARERFNRGEHVLHLAVYLHWTAGVETLLKNGAQPSPTLSKRAGGHTPLHIASQKLYIDCLHLLLSKEAETNAINSSNLTPLDVLGSLHSNKTAEIFLEALQVLIDHGCESSLNDVQCETPLHIALSLNCIQAVRKLHDIGFNRLKKNKKGDTPLHLVVTSISENWLKELVSLYKDTGLDDKNSVGETALHIAVQKLWLAGVTILLDNGADITLTTNQGKTVLHVCQNCVIMKKLLKHENCHQIIDQRDNKDNLVLFCAIECRDIECVFLLIKANADVTLLDRNQTNIIFNVVKTKQLKTLEGLFKRRENDMATMKESTTSSEKLEEATPLHIAVDQGSPECVNILLDNDCDLSTMVKYEYKEYTLLEFAIMKGYHEVVNIILDKRPSLVNEPFNNGLMPIHRACILQHTEVSKIIIDHGGDLAAKCSLLDHSLHFTAMDLFMNRVPGAVGLLENILDNAIIVGKEDITLDYKILLPKVKGCARNHRVLDALIQTGDQVDKGRLFTHVIVESFLAIQWERMKNCYYLLLGMFMILVVIPFHVLVIIFSSKQDAFAFSKITVYFIMILTIVGLIVSLLYDILYLYVKLIQTKYYETGKFHKEVYIFYILTFMHIIFTGGLIYSLVAPKNAFSQVLANVAIILLWIQFMYFGSRIPVYGIYMLKFFEETYKCLVIISSLIPIIFAFATVFFIAFQGLPQFKTMFDAIVKTMITSEFEYSELLKQSDVSTKILFLFFVYLGGIVVMNILGKGIDVSKADKLQKQAEFQSVFENFVLRVHSIYDPRQRINTNQINQSQINTIIIRFNEPSTLPSNLLHRVMQKVDDIKQARK